MSLVAVTAPTTGPVKYDLQTTVGGAWVSLISTLPQIAATKYSGVQAVDGTYRRRTVRGVYAGGDATLPDNYGLKLRCDTDDTGNTSADVVATVHYLEFDRPLDLMRSISDVGE